MYARFGHSSKHFVKLGDKVKKGQKIAEVGTGNGQWSAHCHADFPMRQLPSWTEYVFGLPKEQVASRYADPLPYRRVCFPSHDHLGFGYLEHAQYGSRWCYHPGEDWNGSGAGNSDFGDPIYAPFDGVVVYDFDDGKAKNGGWGRLLVIEKIIIQEEESMKRELIKAIESLTGKDYGDNINDTEQKDAADRLKKVREEILRLREENAEQDALARANADSVAAAETRSSALKTALDECKSQVGMMTLEREQTAVPVEKIGGKEAVSVETETVKSLIEKIIRIIFKK